MHFRTLTPKCEEKGLRGERRVPELCPNPLKKHNWPINVKIYTTSLIMKETESKDQKKDYKDY